MKSNNFTSNILRTAGVLSIIIAAIKFLISGHMDLNSLSSHYLFLGLNILFSVLGIFSHKVWKESTTTRIFLSLSLLMVPVHMAQLGGYFLDIFNPQMSAIPDLFNLNLDKNNSLLLMTLPTLLVVIPSTLIGFNVLSRSDAKKLIFSYFLSNGLFLLPYRAEAILAVIIGLIGVENIMTTLRLNKIKTMESRIANLILFIPFIILSCRSLFYSVSPMFYFILMLFLAVALYYFTPKMIENKFFGELIQEAYVVPLFFGIGQLSSFSFFNFTQSMLIFCILCFFLSYGLESKGEKSRCFSTFLLPFVLMGVYVYYGAMMELLCLFLPFLFALCAFIKRDGLSFKVNALVFIIFFGLKFFTMFGFEYLQNWYIWAFAGVIVIFFAGLLESKGSAYRAEFNQVMKRFD